MMLRTRLAVALVGALLLALAACDSDDGGQPADIAMSPDTVASPDAGPTDALSSDVGSLPDALDTTPAPLDGVADTPRLDDVVPLPDGAGAEVHEDAEDALDVFTGPMPFRVGVARQNLQAPLGMGVAGSGPAPAGTHVSPFARMYPATDRMFSPIAVKALVAEGGLQRVVFVRLDLIGVVKELRLRVARELEARGVPVGEDDLVLTATHTHTAPARLLNKFLWFALADFFWEQHVQRVVGSIADTIEEALADREPARFGYTFAYTEGAQSDRRCENPPLLDGTVPILRFDRADGTPKAAIVVHAIHGTVIGTGEYAFSTDTGGAIEYKTAERFTEPVEVLFLNSWAGDVSVADPREAPPAGPLPDISSGRDKLEAVGNVVADAVLAAWDGIETTDDIEVSRLSAAIALSQDALGYAPEEFPFPYGAVYCGGTDAPNKCVGSDDPMPEAEALLGTCGKFDTAANGLTQTVLTNVRLGDLLLATFPGEPVTQIGLNVVEGIRAATGLEDVAFVGYAQDYIGYSETEEYWWYGGYETSGGTWGPLQGDYLAEEAIALATHFVDPSAPLDVHLATEPLELVPAHPMNPYHDEQWTAEPSAEAPAVVEEPASVTAPETVRVSWSGGDPWIDHPRVELQRQTGDGSWAPFLRHNGTPLANDAYEFTTGLVTEPTYAARRANGPRAFYWWASLPTARIQPTTTPPLLGTFRFHVTGRLFDGDAETTYEVFSAPFTVAEPS